MNKALRFLLVLLLPWLAGCFRGSGHEVGAQLIKLATIREDQWARLVSVTRAPPSPFIAKIEFVTKAEFQDKSVDEALALLPRDYPYSFVFFADERALAEEGFPCICVGLLDEKRPRFRVDAKHIASVENNLTLANMEFSEFADATKATGVIRGF